MDGVKEPAREGSIIYTRAVNASAAEGRCFGGFIATQSPMPALSVPACVGVAASLFVSISVSPFCCKLQQSFQSACMNVAVARIYSESLDALYLEPGWSFQLLCGSATQNSGPFVRFPNSCITHHTTGQWKPGLPLVIS